MNKIRLVGEREAGRQAAVGPQTLRLHGIPIFWPYATSQRKGLRGKEASWTINREKLK